MFSSICTTSSRVGATISARMPALVLIPPAGHQLSQDRPNKCRCLSRTRLCNADDIVPGQNLRNSSQLNRCRLSITSFLNGFLDQRAELQRRNGITTVTVVRCRPDSHLNSDLFRALPKWLAPTQERSA